MQDRVIDALFDFLPQQRSSIKHLLPTAEEQRARQTDRTSEMLRGLIRKASEEYSEARVTSELANSHPVGCKDRERELFNKWAMLESVHRELAATLAGYIAWGLIERPYIEPDGATILGRAIAEARRRVVEAQAAP